MSNSSNPFFKKLISSVKLLRYGSKDLFIRSLIFGRGRRKRFGITPAIRLIKKTTSSYPLIRNCLFYGSLYTGAEFSQQTLKNYLSANSSCNNNSSSKRNYIYDIAAMKRYAILGTVVFPPILHKWYSWLDVKFPTGNLIKKLFLDQFILTPVLVALFFVGMSAMEGKEDWLQECKQKFVRTFFYDCLFWIPMQTINFQFIPSSFRILFIGFCSFIWVNILCTIKNIKMESNQSTC